MRTAVASKPYRRVGIANPGQFTRSENDLWRHATGPVPRHPAQIEMIQMYRLYAAILTIVIVCAGCASAQNDSASAKNAALHGIFATYYQSWLMLNPVEATGLGIHDYDHLLPVDISESHRAAVRMLSASTLDDLAAFERKGLSKADHLNYDILKWTLLTTLRLLEHDDHLMPVNQMFSMPVEFVQLGSGDGVHPFETSRDYQNFIGRMRGFALWVDTAIANMRRGVENGIVLPAVIVRRVLPQLRSIAETHTEESIFARPLQNLDADESDDQDLERQYLAEIRETVLPAYARLLDYMENEYLSAARSTDGLGDIPGGADMYRELIRYWTTTDMSAEDIHNLGLAEVSRIRAGMNAIKKETGFDGSLEDFVRQFYQDDRMTPFHSVDGILQAYAALENKMDPYLDRLFRLRPITPFEVRQIDGFRAASSSAHYQRGAPDGSRPGIFYVPIFDPEQFSVMGMESLFAHEAIPGHHYQISLQQESSDLPDFRNAIYFAAYTEGWALYTESLGSELGLYNEAYSDIARLNSELFRAVRLVVDTGLHAKGWSREEAIEYMVRSLPGWNRRGAANQIERYMVMPAQALSYKLGELAIRQLRDDLKIKRGDAFDIRDFHDQILLGGSMPLSILNRAMLE